MTISQFGNIKIKSNRNTNHHKKSNENSVSEFPLFVRLFVLLQFTMSKFL